MVSLPIWQEKAELKSWKMFLSRQPAKRQLPNRRQRSAVPESIGLAGLSRTINGSPAGNSAIFSRSFRSRICSRCTLRFTKQTSANLPILPMPKCVRILQIPISSASVQPTAAHKQSLPSEAASASGQFKCTSSTTRISIKPARKRFSALPKSLAAQWRIFWKSEINATIAKYEKENAMWRCTINRKTSPLNSPYTEITDEGLRETPTKTNLKNALVADIDADGIIYKSIMEYVQLLNEKSADITLPLASVCSCKVTARVKAQNSIEFKIQNYKTERHEFGKISINKCINDLFGIRIFLREPLTFDEVYSFIEDTYPNRYRCIDSSKFDYKAVHLYFKENNQSFPWELQIWNMCDMDSNFSSQKKYKQEYTAWEKESKEGGIIND